MPEISEKDLKKIQELKEKIKRIKAGNLAQNEKDLTPDEINIFVIYPEEFLSPEDLERIEKEGERTREILEKICVRDRNPRIW